MDTITCHIIFNLEKKYINETILIFFVIFFILGMH